MSDASPEPRGRGSGEADQLGRTAPRLETRRLILRAFRPTDLAAQAAMLADPEVVRHLGGKPQRREEAWRRMLCAPGLWVLLGYGYWAIERREDRMMIGQIGLADFKRNMTPSIEGRPEMGWILSRAAHGLGYASEAADRVLAWADAAGHEEITAIIAPDNGPSIRVAEKAGFVSEGEARYDDEPILLFRRRRPAASPD